MKILPSKDIKTLYKKITGSGNTVIVSHSHPDGDAVGSCAAMLLWLAGMGIRAKAVLPEKYPDYLDFMVDESIRGDFIFLDRDGDAALGAVSEADLIIFQDMNSPSRAGETLCAAIASSAADRILIDHHPDPDRKSFSLVFSETEVSSACELLYHILMRMPGIGSAKNLPRPAAAALMAGMTTDTNNFANSVFPTTLSMASDLLDAGVDRDSIVGLLFNSYRVERIKLMGRLLDRHLKITPYGVAYMILTRRTARQFNIEDGDTEGFVNIPLTAATVKISILLTEEKDRFRVSIRSKRGIKANRLSARYFRGGGHEMAAGGKLMIPGDVRNAKEAAEYIEYATREFLRVRHARVFK